MGFVRRNIAHVSQAERDKLIAAIVQADTAKFYSDNVSYWDKQDQIHQGTHVHLGPSFLPWHRELINRFEALLREVDPDVTLHYWDWTTDPTSSPDGRGGTVDLLTSSNFGSGSGRVGPPFDSLDNDSDPAGSREQTGVASDPPQEITRTVGTGAGTSTTDANLIASGDSLAPEQHFNAFRTALENVHDGVHGFIGGDIAFRHSAFEDPFIYILHSNVDRLWAMWQTVPGKEWRLDPGQVYGDESNHGNIEEYLEPWSGTVHFGDPIPPWVVEDPDNEIVRKRSTHPSVVQPPCYDTNPVTVELQSPSMGAPITFNDVPEDVETTRAAVFSIRTCLDIHLEITAGPGADFGTPLGSTIAVPYTPSQPTTGYVWFSYRGTSAGSSASGSVTIRCVETEQEWTIPISANTVAKPKVASMLILDKSGSMGWGSGVLNASRLDILKWAAPSYVYLMHDDDAIGIVSFDQDAYPVMPVTPAGSPGAGAGRASALAHIAAHSEDNGSTSIGDGLDLGHATINPVAGYQSKAMVVFTDGKENESQFISDVSSLLDERIFAIGLGRADQLDVSVLDALTSGSGGFMLITGELDVNDLFRLNKYFLQVLAGVTNASIVVDPDSWLLPGAEHRIPFDLTDADFEIDVILLSPYPSAIEFDLETPDGQRLGPVDVAALPAISYEEAGPAGYYRAALPIPIGAGSAHEGKWHAILKIDERQFDRFLGGRVRDQGGLSSIKTHGMPYSLSVHARSNVRLSPYVITDSHEPGAQAAIRALLTESELPVSNQARVAVNLERPDGTASVIWLEEMETGIFETMAELLIPGVYTLTFHASGNTRRGQPFTRSEIRTVGIAYGADGPPKRSSECGCENSCSPFAHLWRLLPYTGKRKYESVYSRDRVSEPSPTTQLITRVAEPRSVDDF